MEKGGRNREIEIVHSVPRPPHSPQPTGSQPTFFEPENE